MRSTILTIICMTKHIYENCINYWELEKAFLDKRRWSELEQTLANSRSKRSLQRLQRLQEFDKIFLLITDYCAVVLQAFDDIEDHMAGIAMFDSLYSILPVTYHRTKIKAFELLFKARVGQSIAKEMEHFKEDANDQMVHALWERLSYSEHDEVRRISYENSLRTSPTLWIAYRTLLEYAEWLLKKGKSKEEAMTALHRALTMLAKNKSYQKFEKENERGEEEVEHSGKEAEGG